MKKFISVLILSFYTFLINAEDIDLSLNFEEALPFDFYSKLQFPQCFSFLEKDEKLLKTDSAGTLPELVNISDHNQLKRHSKKLREYQKKIIELKRQKKYKEILQTASEVVAFIKDSYIFDEYFLRRYDPNFLGFYSLRGYRIDMLSALQYTSLSIINSYFEAAKALNDEASMYNWTKVGFEINRWINNHRGCLKEIDIRFRSGNILDNKPIKTRPICYLNSLTESIFSESMALHSMNKEQFDKAIHLASLSLTAIQLTPESQIAFTSAALQRLNNLARLAYSAYQNENWCLSYEGFDKTIKLAAEIDIQPLPVWKTLKGNAGKFYTPIKNNLWNARYGMASKEGKANYLPIRQIPPQYPSSLLEKGREGCVMLTFDITKDGKPKNIEVDWSSNKRFNKSALKSARDYVFSPPYKAGVPSEVEGARTLVVYKIDSRNKSKDYIPPGCE